MSLNTILATAPLTATGYHLKATGTALGQSLIWDNGTNVGIGNQGTTYTLDVSGTGRFTSSLTSDTLLVNAAAQANVTALIQGKVATAGTALKVISDGNGTDKVFEFTGSDGTAAQTMTMLQSGLVGIGIGTPPRPLTVISYVDDGAISSGGNLYSSGYFGTGGFTLGIVSTTGNAAIFNNSNKDMLFGNWNGSTNAERMRITSGGYVGIGVINPITKLSVAGSIAMGNNTDGTTNLSYGGKISAKQTQVTGGAGATLIHRGLGSVGYFILVSGIGGPSNTYRFTDLIYGTGTNTPSVLASSTVGSAPTRTYSMSSENIYVALSGGDTYTVTTTGLGAMES